MTVFFPIVDRELRVASRRRGTFWLRVSVGVLGALVVIFQMGTGDFFGGPTEAGRYAFNALVIAASVLCCCASLMTSDAIISERDEGTLGLLFLAPVSAGAVLLGKLAPSLITGLAAICSLLPSLMICVLSGGVTGGEVFRKGLVFGCALFLSLAVGLHASSPAREGHQAAWRGFLRGFVLMLAPCILEGLFRAGSGGSQFSVGLLSPWIALAQADDVNFSASPSRYWISLLLIQGIGWFHIWRASVVLRHSLHETEFQRPESSRASVTDDGALPVAPAQRKKFGGDVEPLRWLLERQRGVQTLIWVGALVAVLTNTMLGSMAGFFFGMSTFGLLLMPVQILFGTLRTGLFAWAVTRFFVEARKHGELELLLTTPEGARQLASAQLLALKRRFLWPTILMVLPMLLQLLFAMVNLVSARSFTPAPYLTFYPVSMLLSILSLVIGIRALCHVGVWFGLKSQTQRAAVISVLLWVFGFPTLVMMGWRLLRSLLSMFGPGLFGYAMWLIPQTAVIAYYFWLIWRTKKLIGNDLRAVEDRRLGWGKGIPEMYSDLMVKLRAVRHWTPGDHHREKV